jgi:hypothetical protein
VAFSGPAQHRDLPFLQALMPVMLAGSISHHSLPGATRRHLAQAGQQPLIACHQRYSTLTQQLFDVLAMPVTRGPLTGALEQLGEDQPGSYSAIFWNAGRTAA